MIESSDRVEAFRSEIAEMKVRDPATGRDRLWLGIGVVLMVLGVGLCVVGYAMSHGTTNPLEQRDSMTLAITGVAVSVVGAALFVRYSMAAFLRFWLARLIYEQKTQTDRLLDK
jgi:hypothetical protein